ncbi:MAG: hypothetical protein IPI73_25845 [Betaproteobacteria bacterium]|nr:hypothetical protein [Betaproteobacteria bacterium]
MSEETYEQPVPEQLQDGIPAADGDDTDDLLQALETGAQVDPKSGQKMVTVPLGTLVGLRKSNREGAKRIKELEPQAARVNEVNERLAQASPIIDAVLNNPKLRAEAIRQANGTRTSSDATEQPDDAEAVELAEEFGFYLADGVTPDAARGMRVLARMDKRAGRATAAAVQPFAGLALGQQAETNLARAMAMTDEDGVPLATPESIRETAKMLPANLLANPQVVELVINNAIGLDRRTRRTPKAQDEPLYLAAQGGRRGASSTAITAEDRAFMQRHGITEKDYLRSTKNLEQGVSGRRGITLGGDN